MKKFEDLFEQRIFTTDKEKDEILKKKVTLNNIFWISFLGSCALRKNYKDNEKVKNYFIGQKTLKLDSINNASNDILYSIKMLVDRGSMTIENANKLTKIMAKLKTGAEIKEGILFKSIKEFMVGKIITPILPSKQIVDLIRDFKKSKITLNDMIIPMYNFAKGKNIAIEYQELAKPIINKINQTSATHTTAQIQAQQQTAANMLKTASNKNDKKDLNKIAKKNLNEFEQAYQECENDIDKNGYATIDKSFMHLLETVYKNKNLDHFSTDERKKYFEILDFVDFDLAYGIIILFNKTYNGAAREDKNTNILYKMLLTYDNLNIVIYKACAKFVNTNADITKKMINSRINYHIYYLYLDKSKNTIDLTFYDTFLQSNLYATANDQLTQNFFKEWSSNGQLYSKYSDKLLQYTNNVLMQYAVSIFSKVQSSDLDQDSIHTDFKKFILGNTNLLDKNKEDILITHNIISKDDIKFDLKKVANKFVNKPTLSTIKTELRDNGYNVSSFKDVINLLQSQLLEIMNTDKNQFDFWLENYLVSVYYDDLKSLLRKYDYSQQINNDSLRLLYYGYFAKLGTSIFENVTNIETNFIINLLEKMSDYNISSNLEHAVSNFNRSNDIKGLEICAKISNTYFDRLLNTNIFIASRSIRIFENMVQYTKVTDDMIMMFFEKNKTLLKKLIVVDYVNESLKKKMIDEYIKKTPDTYSRIEFFYNEIDYVAYTKLDKSIIKYIDNNVFKPIIESKSFNSSVFVKFLMLYRLNHLSPNIKFDSVINFIDDYFSPLTDYSKPISECFSEIEKTYKNINYSPTLNKLIKQQHAYYNIKIVRDRVSFEFNRRFIDPELWDKHKTLITNYANKPILEAAARHNFIADIIEYEPMTTQKVEHILKVLDVRNNARKRASYVQDLKYVEGNNSDFYSFINESNIDDLLSGINPKFANTILNRYVQENIVNNAIVDDIMDPKRNKGIIPDVPKDPAKIKEILKFNNFSLTNIKATKKKNESYSDSLKRNKKESNNIFKGKMPKINVQQVIRTKDELNQMSINKHDKYHAGKHGDIAVKILEEFNVTLPSEEWNDFRAEFTDKSNHVYPAFHGTGTIAASMILRFGFKVIDSDKLQQTGTGFAGRMLGDGVYFGITLDKVAGYVGDGGWRQRYGQIGYIFEMDATLGADYWDHRSAGLGNDSIRSPEYVVFNARKQLKIIKVYRVELTSIKQINKLRKTKLNENKFDNILLKDIVLNEEKRQKDSLQYVFYDGDVITPNGKVKNFENIKIIDRKNVSINPHQQGIMLQLNNNLGLNGVVNIPNPFEFMNKDPEGLFTQYQELMKKKIK